MPRASKALCEQVRSVSRQRLELCLGTLSAERLAAIRTALDRHFWFDLPT